jgi:acylphosphatase
MTDQPEKSVRAHVFISGRVQGVGFRWNTQTMAQRLGLTGWVRNLWDGRVEAVFEGPETIVGQAVQWCHHGQRPASVEDVKVNYETHRGEFNHFRVTS